MIKFSDNDVKKTINVLSKKANMSNEDLNKIYEEIKYDLLERGVPDDDRLEERILGAIQARLKKRFIGLTNLVSVQGSVFGRSNAMDRAIVHHKITEAYIEKYGEEKAREDGYINKEGNHLYVINKNEPTVEINGKKRNRIVFENQVGKVIPEHDWEADGYGIINYKQKNNDDIRFAEFKLRGEAAVKPLPLFRECDMNVFIRNKKDKTKFAVTLSSVPVTTDEGKERYIDFDTLVPFIERAYPDRVVKELINVYQVAEELIEDNIWNPWLLIRGNIINVSSTQNDWIAVNLDDTSLSLERDADDVEDIFVLIPGNMDVDFRRDALGAYFFVNPSIRNGKLTLFGLGYWVEHFDRAKRENVSEEPDTQAPWG
ncbi:MAG: hypothetical protein GYA51_06790 [Candidatus Methanofastidiosa archaeon]|nr:hypothetical protein [Candidatus Methanofastidiosa archaeon]